ncbi:unnamed protein product [Dicrocoelium dendriticum]|nr:unnamed protein product [Dicrocoelium dendriticum]
MLLFVKLFSSTVLYFRSNKVPRSPVLQTIHSRDEGCLWIGLAIVTKLAQEYCPTGEWDVYLTARNAESGMKACKELNDKGLHVKFRQLDITNSANRKSFLDYMKLNYPKGINIVVNNAGIAYKGDSTAPFGEQARVTVNTNFTCTVDFTLELIPLLAENARVVQVSSTASHLTLKKLSDELYAKFTSAMSLDELRSLVADFVKNRRKTAFTKSP